MRYEIVKKVAGITYHYHGWDYANGKPLFYWNYINGGKFYSSLARAKKAKEKVDAYCRALNDNIRNAKMWKANPCKIREINLDI